MHHYYYKMIYSPHVLTIQQVLKDYNKKFSIIKLTWLFLKLNHFSI